MRKPAPRVRRNKTRAGEVDDEALREAVRRECLKRFERLLGRPWDAELERLKQAFFSPPEAE